MEHQNIVREIIEKSKYYDHLGKNINFFATAYDPALYQEDNFLGSYKRIKVHSQAGLLVTKPIPNAKKDTYFASIVSDTDKLRFGVR